MRYIILHRNRGTFFFLAACFAAIFVGCDYTTHHTDEIGPTYFQAKPLSDSLQFEEPLYYGAVLETRIIGCERVIISLELDGDIVETDIPTISIAQINDRQLKPTYISQAGYLVYAVFDGLEPNSDYTISATIGSNQNAFALSGDITVSTPASVISIEQVDKEINALLADAEIDGSNRLLAETQACMVLLGMDTDAIGTFGFLTQANLVRFEYTCNSLDTFTDTKHIMGEPSESLLSLLKSEVSVWGIDGQADCITDFKLIPHELTEYSEMVIGEKNYLEYCSECDNFCGKIDIDRYIYDLSLQEPDVYQTYSDFPFIIDTPEFESKYGGETLNLSQKESEAAKNKAMFSLHQYKWLKMAAIPTEKEIVVAATEGDTIAVSTLIALSYLAIDAYNETGEVIHIRSGIRTYHEQELIYYQTEKQSDINYWRGLGWYKERQKVAAAPGFSNHQYGVAIDFEGKYNGGISSFVKLQPKLYKFLLENGPSYGFYRNSSEAWHWAYLGKTF